MKALTLRAEEDPTKMSPHDLLSYTEHNLVLFDKFPKSYYHFLIIPRIQPPHLTASRLRNLRELFKGDKQTAKEVIDRLKTDADALCKDIEGEMVRRRKFKWDIWVGFHAVQSMDHVHLHVISADLLAPGMKHKKHYNSFHPRRGFFIHLDDILDWFEAVPNVWRRNIELNRAFFEPLLKEPLECFYCYEEMKNMPKLKEHIREHWEALREEGKSRAEQKKMQEAKLAARKKKMEAKQKEESADGSKQERDVEDEKRNETKTAENVAEEDTGDKRPSAEPAPEVKPPQKKQRTRLQDPDEDWEF
ncbi:HIT-like domain-containing protein [Schizophyllum fasciatum]